MRLFVLVGALTLLVAGCQREAGSGLWNLKVGGEAKLISSDGSDITLETRGAAGQNPTSRRSSKTSRVEEVKLPAGTTVMILAIDGDDARVEVKDGSHAKAIYWVECARLEALTR
jgi:hypothetical protein